MLASYAQPSDLAESPWNLTVETAAAERLLSYASRLIRRATTTALYDAHPDTGHPTETALQEALRDATCAQVAAWVQLSIDPAAGAGSSGGTIASKSLGGASIQYVAHASTVEARARASTLLNPDARMILEDAGLVGQMPVVWG